MGSAAQDAEAVEAAEDDACDDAEVDPSLCRHRKSGGRVDVTVRLERRSQVHLFPEGYEIGRLLAEHRSILSIIQNGNFPAMPVFTNQQKQGQNSKKAATLTT